MLAPARSTRALLLWLLLIMALGAAACGDDGSSGGPANGSDNTGTPIRGGELTALYFSDLPSLDPARFTGGASSEGHMGFALYGALVGLDGESLEVEPILAESLKPNTDFSEWVLTLRPQMVFTDGTAFDADAVVFNWERIADPATGSPGGGLMATVADLEAVDERTVRIRLTAPNAHFPQALSQTGSLNSIASPAAIESGRFATDPVGAGPYVIESRLTDSMTTFVPNPDWAGSDGPYLNRFTIRIVGDELQRLDTFETGAADLLYTLVNQSVVAAVGNGAEVASFPSNTGSTIQFNTAAPPFDDVRARRAVALAIDRDALVDVAQPGDEVAHATARPGSPWATSGTDLPAYDPEAAQELFDELAAEHGGPVRFTLGAFQTPQNQQVARFVQTALGQLDNVEVELAIVDASTAITKVLSGDYQAHTLGSPWIDPEPRLYSVLRSGQFTNTSRYSSDEVDAALDAARATADFDARYAQMEIVQRRWAEDLPILPYLHSVNNWVYRPHVHGVRVYEDGILRSDLLWRAG